MLCINIWDESFYTTLWSETDTEKKVSIHIDPESIISFIRNVDSEVIEFNFEKGSLDIIAGDNTAILNQVNASPNHWDTKITDDTIKIYSNSNQLLDAFSVLPHTLKNTTIYYLDIERKSTTLFSKTENSLSFCEIPWIAKVTQPVSIELPSKLLNAIRSYFIRKESTILEFIVDPVKNLLAVEFEAGIIICKTSTEKIVSKSDLTVIKKVGIIQVSTVDFAEIIKEITTGKKAVTALFELNGDILTISTELKAEKAVRLYSTVIDSANQEVLPESNSITASISKQDIVVSVVSKPPEKFLVDVKLLFQILQKFSGDYIQLVFASVNYNKMVIHISDHVMGAVHALQYTVPEVQSS